MTNPPNKETNSHFKSTEATQLEISHWCPISILKDKAIVCEVYFSRMIRMPVLQLILFAENIHITLFSTNILNEMPSL